VTRVAFAGQAFDQSYRPERRHSRGFVDIQYAVQSKIRFL
jgi:hypothetical protein